MPDNPTTALVKTAQSPALARVSSQLALTDKLLLRKQPMLGNLEKVRERPIRPEWPTEEEYEILPKQEQKRILEEVKTYNAQMENYNAHVRVENYTKARTCLTQLFKRQEDKIQEPTNESTARLNEQVQRFQQNISQMERQLMNNPLTKELIYKLTIRL